MDHNYYASYANIRLRPLRKTDIEHLRMWRNDEKNTQFLRKIGHITAEMQESWFQSYLQNEQEICFAIEETTDLNRLVGSLSLYDFNGDEAEIGKILIGDSEAHGRGIGRFSLVMAMKIGFKKLKLKRIIASVHRENVPSRSIFRQVGTAVVGNHPSVVGGVEDIYSIDEQRLCEINTYVPQIRLD